jgi:uncharacterized protein
VIDRPARALIAALAVLVLVLIIGRAASVFYTDVLWFASVGHLDVFWARIRTLLSVRAVSGTLGAAIVWVNLLLVARHLGPVHLRRRFGNIEIAEQVPRRYVSAGIALVALLAGWWLSELLFPGEVAVAIRAWIHSEPWGLRDPVFNQDLGFYVFALPVLVHVLDFLLLASVWALLVTLVGYVLVGAVRVRDNRIEIDETPRLHFAILVAALVLLIGARYWLGRYGVLLGGTGFSGAVGYTDLHARLPAQRVLAVLSVAVAGALIYGALRRVWWPPLTALGLLIIASVTLGYIYPSIVQQLQVEPNQLARESPYIRRNIDFTRLAYDLEDIDRRPFRYAPQQVPAWNALAPGLSRLPLWDTEPLRAAFNQVQALLGFYHFPGVRIDSYGPVGEEETVAIAVREFTRDGMQPASRTWRNLHLNARQVRGVGAVVTPVARKTQGGDPVFWLSGMDPVQRNMEAPPALELTQSSVYYSETSADYLILGTDAPDVVEGANGGGVQLTSFVRTIAFAWRFGDRNLLFASELNVSSRLAFRRRVTERLNAVAPFLLWDQEPLPVIADGRLVWLVDGYSSSTTFPLSAEQRLFENSTLRYVRSSVKAAVDAVDGAVTLYALRSDEPLLETYRRAFPGLIRPLSEMPPVLQSHLRYPAALARLQARVLEAYHVDQPADFFSGQEAWQIPGETAVLAAQGGARPIELMAPVPGESRPSFMLSVPFIARERQNMTAMLLVRHGLERYGQKQLIVFPRDERVPGPTQVRTIVEQDPAIAQQLSLWRQGGSTVELGRIRTIPLDSGVVYVQPLFLSATQGSIPQLHRVIVSDGTVVGMAETLAAAVNGLYGRRSDTVRGSDVPLVSGRWAADAVELLEEAESRLRDGDLAGFGAVWERLQRLLRRAAAEGGNP